MFKSIQARISLLLIMAAALAACTTSPAASVPEPVTTALPATLAPEATTALDEPEPSTAVGDEPAAAGALAFDEQAAYYVSRLPRPADVPTGWRMDRTPQYQERMPAPGDTYRFACEELPSRSVGLATVGYRSLDALPSMTVEYAVYPTADDAASALEDMRRAALACDEFAIRSDDDGPPNARLTPLDFPDYGSSSFGAALETDTSATGSLLTHVIKIQRGNVVVGINHANWGDQPPPDDAITEQMARLTLDYLARED